MGTEFNRGLGVAAGQVWKALSETGQASATKLSEATGLDRNEIQRAIGWLAREDKIRVERKGKNEFFSLAD
ncbi:MAG: winged helix-turn-helix domain-containing protein [Methylococcaceae bacterium]|nr:winged helix-turn-helix domain-containing protein [Methylococcaceae bacterium]